jgi:hypothetical protein
VVDRGEMALTEASAPSLAGDHVVMLAGAPATAFAVDACSGEATALAGEGLSGAFALTGEAGALALGHRQPSGEVLLLDRLDEPGLDEPRVIAALDPIDSGWFRWPDGLLLWSGPLMRDTPGTSRIFLYPGAAGPDGSGDAGGRGCGVAGPRRARCIRRAHGRRRAAARARRRGHARAPARAQRRDGPRRRAGGLAGGRGRVDAAHVRDRRVDVQLGAVDAATQRSAGPDAESWRWTDDAVAAIDADGALVAAHDREDRGAPRGPAAHLTARDDVPGPLLFVTAQVTPERVELAWDPRTGELTEWYRGPDVTLRPQRADDAGVRYHADPGRLWSHRSGRRAAAGRGEPRRDLARGRPHADEPDEPRRDAPTHPARRGRRARPRTLADGVSRWSLTADDPPRLAYAVSVGPDTGVWVVPLAPLTSSDPR